MSEKMQSSERIERSSLASQSNQNQHLLAECYQESFDPGWYQTSDSNLPDLEIDFGSENTSGTTDEDLSSVPGDESIEDEASEPQEDFTQYLDEQLPSTEEQPESQVTEESSMPWEETAPDYFEETVWDSSEESNPPNEEYIEEPLPECEEPVSSCDDQESLPEETVTDDTTYEDCKDVTDLIDELGHPDFDTREKASKGLLELGEAALPNLEEAAKSEDPEVANRAKLLINKIGYPPVLDSPYTEDDLRTTDTVKIEGHELSERMQKEQQQ